MELELKADINQKRHNALLTVQYLVDTDFFIDQRKKDSDDSSEEYYSPRTKKAFRKWGEYLKPILDTNCMSSENTYTIFNKIVEANCDPKLLYNSNEIAFCQGVCMIYEQQQCVCDFITRQFGMISIDKFINMDNVRQQKYSYDLSNTILETPGANEYLADLVKNGCNWLLKNKSCTKIFENMSESAYSKSTNIEDCVGKI